MFIINISVKRPETWLFYSSRRTASTWEKTDRNQVLKLAILRYCTRSMGWEKCVCARLEFIDSSLWRGSTHLYWPRSFVDSSFHSQAGCKVKRKTKKKEISDSRYVPDFTSISNSLSLNMIKGRKEKTETVSGNNVFYE